MSTTQQTADRIEKQVLALSSANPSLTHKQLGALVNRSTKTIQRIMKDNAAMLTATDSILNEAQVKIREVMPVSRRVEEYVSMLNVAKVTKQPSAGAAILQRLDDLDGIITEKERLRAKAHDQPASQPMFALPPGATLQFTLTTTNSALPISNDANEGMIDVTPTKQSNGLGT